MDVVTPGAPPAYCGGKTAPSVYVVTSADELLEFDPPSGAFNDLGPLECPTMQSGSGAFSMAVAHDGTAYVVYDDGELFTADIASAACTATTSPIDTSSFTPTFGMGFSTDPDGLGETLYLSGDSTPGLLGTLDTTSFVVAPVGPFSSNIGEAELTGTGDGRLFAFGVGAEPNGADLAELDKTSAAILSDIVVPTPAAPVAWAFAFWGGDFYFFTSVDRVTTVVGRFHPPDGTFDATYATLATGAVTGAGVSTCAPR